MKYLSFDLEATGLAENDYIIEFAMIPFDAKTCTLQESLAREYLIRCPSFSSMEKKLDPWVIENNKSLIEKASNQGIPLEEFKKKIAEFLKSTEVKQYFLEKKIILFGKSLNAIDLPFLNRDLGWEFMRRYFHHQVNDLSSVAMALADMNLIPKNCVSGSELMQYLKLGEVKHTALADAKNTAIMYFKLIEKLMR